MNSFLSTCFLPPLLRRDHFVSLLILWSLEHLLTSTSDACIYKNRNNRVMNIKLMLSRILASVTKDSQNSCKVLPFVKFLLIYFYQLLLLCFPSLNWGLGWLIFCILGIVWAGLKWWQFQSNIMCKSLGTHDHKVKGGIRWR